MTCPQVRTVEASVLRLVGAPLVAMAAVFHQTVAPLPSHQVLAVPALLPPPAVSAVLTAVVAALVAATAPTDTMEVEKLTMIKRRRIKVAMTTMTSTARLLRSLCSIRRLVEGSGDAASRGHQ